MNPEGWHSVTPRIVALDTEGLVEFVKRVFDATGEYRSERPTVLSIGDSNIMISDGGGVRGLAPAFLYVYVDDADHTYRQAIQAGAVTVEEPSETPYGDRRAMVTDRWGNTWQIATYRGA